MKIFSREIRSNRLNGPLPIDSDTGLYSRNFFLLRLKEERERTKRTGNPFSLVVVDVAGMSTVLNGGAGGSSGIQDTAVVDLLRRNARKSDIKGWFDVKRVGILMPDTGEPGAIEVRGKICDRIRENWPAAGGLSLERFVRAYTFSYQSVEGNGSSLNDSNLKSCGRGGDESVLYADILSPGLHSAIERILKRILDIVAAIFGIGITSPLMLIIAALIKLTSSGPVLFRQERVGFLGRTFVFLKFRSMFADVHHAMHEEYITDLINGRHERVDNGTEVRPLYKMINDSRVTPVGRVLRKTSLDELPQLFNVLKGDMSVVGPRPPIPYEVEKYRLWHSARVFEVKPGLTGLWQVSGRSRTTFDDMVRLDLRYANNWSLWLDFKIILKTIPAVLFARGAY